MIWLAHRPFRLEIQNFPNAITGKDVVIASSPLVESEIQQERNEIGEPDIRVSPSTENTFKKLRMSSHAIIPSPLPKRRDAIRQSLASDSRYCRYYRSVSRTAWKCKSQIPISTTARAERGVGPTHFTNMTRRSATAELRSVSSIINHRYPQPVVGAIGTSSEGWPWRRHSFKTRGPVVRPGLL